ncbi:hypothetical protein F3Y22_tig00008013pilonHSYRG00293 [Hibiscus syriacus]|uniref:Uncharacterized protein n=1 Tax=Hibiscus syriacus TaxID=106335 RepID=A0A6A3CFM5_HIBSY|nr:uncharacterized protein LOC120201912 [Hibiscus syriacus]KAE8725949.1 hypothetical protein F3Y22_tig00008013pilonHSYRG00293 [Hibiscus syriacus]
MKSNTITMEDDFRTETRDSCYYPGCRKDANCNCEMCIASINATLDLMSVSVQKSSFTKLSASKPKFNHLPISFDPSVISTPGLGSCCLAESPALKSTARLNSRGMKMKKKKGGLKSVFWKLLLGMNLVLVMEIGFSWVLGGFLRPVLTSDIVRSIGERASIMKDLSAKMRFMQNELKGFHNLKVSNCSNNDSIWEIDQGSMLLNSHCLMHKSSMEEVRIWGWPMQTAGLLATGFSSKSFTVLSGRVKEWSNGNHGFVVTRKANASWEQSKWDASVIQLDPNTWIFEYQRSSILEHPRLISAALELFKYGLIKMVKKMSEQLVLLFVFDNHYIELTGKYEQQLLIPT